MLFPLQIFHFESLPSRNLLIEFIYHILSCFQISVTTPEFIIIIIIIIITFILIQEKGFTESLLN